MPRSRKLAIWSVSSSVSVGFMPAVGSSSRSSTGLGDQRAGDLEPAPVGVGERAREVIEPRHQAIAEDAQAPRATRSRAAAPRARTRGGRSTAPSAPVEVRVCVPTSTFSITRHVGEQADVLEGARDAALDDHVRREPGDVLTVERGSCPRRARSAR